MKKNLSLSLKILTVVASLLGVTIALINAEYDGYFPWWKRLFYFTTLSNVWIGLTMLALLILAAFKYNGKWKGRVYTLKYVFTVAITITGIVFCGLLAPFADESYHAWSFSSLLTHVFTPIFAIADFFLDDYPLRIRGFKTFYSIIPPLLYFILCLILGAFNFDFGKGDTFPYFFLDFNTEAGFFGFVLAEPRPIVGSAYWIIVMLMLNLLLGWAYAALHRKVERE